MLRIYNHMITDIFVFPNDMVAVTDQEGKQMSFFQGKRIEVMPRIKRRIARQKGIIEYHVNNAHFTPQGTYEVDYTQRWIRVDV